MSIFSQFFGGSSASCLANVDDALIVDVRTREEFGRGHVKGSVNIPLQEIHDHVDDLKNSDKQVILCCASGNRSGHATNMLKSRGIECCNGGSWMTVNQAKYPGR